MAGLTQRALVTGKEVDMEGIARTLRPGPSAPQLKATTTSALTKIIHPTSANITLSGQVPPEFSVNAVGRIVPVGTFQGGLGALEYFYRLAGPLTEDPTATRVTAIDIQWMICTEDKRQVAFEVFFLFKTPAFVVVADYNLSAVGIFVFNKQGKVCSYDWTIRRLGFLTETNQEKIAGVLGLTLDQFHVLSMETACTTAQTYCTGNLTQFTTKAECVGFLRDELPYGSWDLADQNNAVCRILHSILVPVRPHVHCAHVGRSGGGKCITHAASLLFTEEFQSCRNE
eukprot:gene7384-7593_t